MKFIIDAHQDLAWNMHVYNRDYTRSVSETRQMEAGSQTPKMNGDTMLGWPEYQAGRIAVIIASLFALPLRKKHEIAENYCYADSNQAYNLYSKQLDTYHRLANDHPDKFKLILSQSQLGELVSYWTSQNGESENKNEIPVGIIPSIEGAECIRHPSELEQWWSKGVRLIGLAWAGNRYCGGTNEPGPLLPLGYELLEAMAEFGYILDISHMDEQAALAALDYFPGQIVASHSNVSALLKGYDGNRHLSDHMIRKLIERDAVIGTIPYNKFLLNGWRTGDKRAAVSIEHYTAHIDYICQIAGDTTHAAIGSDFDGGFGLQSVPDGIDSISDLGKIVPILSDMGYSKVDIENIMSKNWLERLNRALPEIHE